MCSNLSAVNPQFYWSHLHILFLLGCIKILCNLIFLRVPSSFQNRHKDASWGQSGQHGWHQHTDGWDYKKHWQYCTTLELLCRIYVNPASQRWPNKAIRRMIPQRQQRDSSDRHLEGWKENKARHPKSWTALLTWLTISLFDFKQNSIERKIH